MWFMGKDKAYTEIEDESIHNPIPADLASVGANGRSSSNSLTDYPDRRTANANIWTPRGLWTYLVTTVKNTTTFSLVTFVLFLICGAIFMYMFVQAEELPVDDTLNYYIQSNPSIIFPDLKIRSVAFGSCTAYDMRDMSIWTDAIIPSKPDAFIWAGDFMYLDGADVDCSIPKPDEYWQKSCNCTPTWLAFPPHSCRGGDIDYANERWLRGLRNGITHYDIQASIAYLTYCIYLV